MLRFSTEFERFVNIVNIVTVLANLRNSSISRIFLISVINTPLPVLQHWVRGTFFLSHPDDFFSHPHPAPLASPPPPPPTQPTRARPPQRLPPMDDPDMQQTCPTLEEEAEATAAPSSVGLDPAPTASGRLVFNLRGGNPPITYSRFLYKVRKSVLQGGH